METKLFCSKVFFLILLSTIYSSFQAWSGQWFPEVWWYSPTNTASEWATQRPPAIRRSYKHSWKGRSRGSTRAWHIIPRESHPNPFTSPPLSPGVSKFTDSKPDHQVTCCPKPQSECPVILSPEPQPKHPVTQSPKSQPDNPGILYPEPQPNYWVTVSPDPPSDNNISCFPKPQPNLHVTGSPKSWPDSPVILYP